MFCCLPEDCQKNPCLNGGTCRELGKDEYNCQCTEDYKGDHCEIGLCFREIRVSVYRGIVRRPL